MKLSAQKLREALDYSLETGIFTRKIRTSNRVKIGDVAGSVKPHGYVKINVGGHGCFYAHRLAWLYVTGEWPVGSLDHKNGDTADNRFSNLREATRSQNAINRRSRGVRFNGSKWTAQIGAENKSVHIGSYGSEGDARAAYLERLSEIHGPEWVARKVDSHG